MRYAFLFAIGVAAAFAACNALIGPGAFRAYSAWLAIGLVIALVEIVLRLRMGASLAPMRCPNCATPQPFVRGPISFRRSIQGGWACTKCAIEIDRYGRAVEGKD
jgi:hypothetical protein